MSSGGSSGDKFNCCDSCSDFDQCRADRACFFGKVTEAVVEELFADAPKLVPESKLIEAETSRDELAAILARVESAAQPVMDELNSLHLRTRKGACGQAIMPHPACAELEALIEEVQQALARAGRG